MSPNQQSYSEEPPGIRRPLTLTLISLVCLILGIRWIGVLLLIYGPAILTPGESLELLFISLEMQPSLLNFALGGAHAILLTAGGLWLLRMSAWGLAILFADAILISAWMFLPMSPNLLNASGIGISIIAFTVGLLSLPKEPTD